jgi:hypothetical protein
VTTTHLIGMSMTRTTCAECGGPIEQRVGRGRPRVYCGPACRNVAYEKRKGTVPCAAAKPAAAPSDAPLVVGDLLQLPQFRAAREERLISIDRILDSPTSTHDLMCELICRIAIGAVLEDVRYQDAISKLAVAYGMVGRITNGDFRLPAVASVTSFPR